MRSGKLLNWLCLLMIVIVLLVFSGTISGWWIIKAPLAFITGIFGCFFSVILTIVIIIGLIWIICKIFK
jgi:hypothetical protein